MDISMVRFDDRGLVPAIVQEENGQVLMLAYMNKRWRQVIRGFSAVIISGSGKRAKLREMCREYGKYVMTATATRS